MRDFVSQRIGVAVLAMSMWTVYGVFIPPFPWAGVVWASSVLALSIWMLGREPLRSIAQVIREVEAEPARTSVMPIRVARPALAQSCDR